MLVAEIMCALFLSTAGFYYIKQRKSRGRVSLLISMLVCLGILIVIRQLFGMKYDLSALRYLFMSAICFPAAWIDVQEKKIPNAIVVCGLILWMGVAISELISDSLLFVDNLKSSGIALAIIAAFCLLGRVIVKNGMGMGDIKLLLVLALLAGNEVVISVLLMTLIGAFFMGLYMLIIKKAGRDATIPFAPAILFGVYAVSVLLAF